MIYNIYLNIIVKVLILKSYTLIGPIGSGKTEAQKIFQQINIKSLSDVEKAWYTLLSTPNKDFDTAAKKALKTELDSVSYAIGMDVARNVKTNVSEIDSELFMQGYRNYLDSTNILIKEEDCQQVLTYIAGDRLKREEVIMNVDDNENTEERSNRDSVFKDAVINDRQDALRLLRDIATFFRKTEPHSPISYSVEQIIRWSSMSLTDLIQELIPDEPARKKYQHLSGISSNTKE